MATRKHSVAHPFAKYTDSAGKTIQVSYLTLGPPTNAHIALAAEVFRTPNGQQALYIRRSSSGLYHFATFSGNPARRRRYTRKEIDPAHTQAVQDLLDAIGSSTRVEIVTRVFKKDQAGNSYAVDEILAQAKTDSYDWGKERSRILTNRATVRHDVFGAAKGPKMSVRTPMIAIEVIKDHAPETRALLAMLSATKHTPYIVLLQFLDAKKSRHFETTWPDPKTLRIRSTFVLAEGKVFKNGTEVKKIWRQRDFKVLVAKACA